MNALTLHLNNQIMHLSSIQRRKAPLHDYMSTTANPLIGKDYICYLRYMARFCEIAFRLLCERTVSRKLKVKKTSVKCLGRERRPLPMTQFSYCVSSRNIYPQNNLSVFFENKREERGQN